YALAPERWYPEPLVKPEVGPRWWTLSRLTYSTVLLTGLGWMTYLTGKPWGLYYVLLWIIPLLTVFPFLMMLREEIQHGHAGQQRPPHSRTFRGNPLFCRAVSPLAMDYHLPHHLFPLVPHYRLKQLHQLLLETDVYRHEAPVVEGYVFPRKAPAA